MPTLGDGATKIQFATSDEMPHLIYRACLRTGTRSNTIYLQLAVCEALARDLDLPYDDLVAHLPPARGRSTNLIPDHRPSRADRMRERHVIEEVR